MARLVNERVLLSFIVLCAFGLHLSDSSLDSRDRSTPRHNLRPTELPDINPYNGPEGDRNNQMKHNEHTIGNKPFVNCSGGGILNYATALTNLFKSTLEVSEKFPGALDKNELQEFSSEINRVLASDSHYSVARGRKVKTKKFLMYLVLGMKVLNFGLILPIIIGLTILAAWKGITISLLAFMLASIVGIKSLFSKPTGESSDHHHPTTIVVTKFPYHLSSDWSRSSNNLPF
ncbi:hypothetical protein AAG570_009388 [Ranatra chinensis]|uniref:Uncharacterized protein n=1 Tax=Ranatra chinensis TaxID=642074 RepID=A0ABD0Z1Y0_9HEMI